MIKFNSRYFIAFVLLFLIEVAIALWVHDDFIRPYLGDVLVVILIYTFVLSFFRFSKIKTAIFVLLFAFAIELAQYFQLVEHLGLQDNKLAKVVLGSSFSVADLFCYLAGIIGIALVERFFFFKNKQLFDDGVLAPIAVKSGDDRTTIFSGYWAATNGSTTNDQEKRSNDNPLATESGK